MKEKASRSSPRVPVAFLRIAITHHVCTQSHRPARWYSRQHNSCACFATLRPIVRAPLANAILERESAGGSSPHRSRSTQRDMTGMEHKRERYFGNGKESVNRVIFSAFAAASAGDKFARERAGWFEPTPQTNKTQPSETPEVPWNKTRLEFRASPSRQRLPGQRYPPPENEYLGGQHHSW